MRHLHPAAADPEVGVPRGTGQQDLLSQVGRYRLRQHHHAVLAPLAVTHHDDPAVEVHILDTQAHPFHEAHAGAIEQLGQQSHLVVKKLEQGAHLVAGQHAGNALFLGRSVQAIQPGKVDGQHLAVQKEQGAQRLVVRGR
jgi:hypothetical protein